jgi:excinuclease ABC subunit C
VSRAAETAEAGPRAAVARLPTGPGVYRFRDGRGRVLYVGRAGNLRRRVRSYWGDLRDRSHLAPMVRRIARIDATECRSEHEAAWFERNMLERALPPWNRARGGGEVPVFIRVIEGRRAAGLSLVHEVGSGGGARHFGPYLGGTKVRLAVSALHRMLPLGYAADGLAGSRRELARLLGVESADREQLVRTAVAVLDREPDAVAAFRTALARRRDDLVRRLAFELAAQVQAEMAAIEWVTSEQQAIAIEPYDVDVYGWAGHVLVHFEVRDGRLCGWRVRPCAQRRAKARVAATPAAWAEFARHNAELAARLLPDSARRPP